MGKVKQKFDEGDMFCIFYGLIFIGVGIGMALADFIPSIIRSWIFFMIVGVGLFIAFILKNKKQC